MDPTFGHLQGIDIARLWHTCTPAAEAWVHVMIIDHDEKRISTTTRSSRSTCSISAVASQRGLQ